MGEPSHLDVPRREKRRGQPAALAVRGWTPEHPDPQWLEQGLLEGWRSGHHRRRAGQGRFEHLQCAVGSAAGWPKRVCRIVWWRQSTAAEALAEEGVSL